MGLNSEDPIDFIKYLIKYLLESKSTAKQTAYKHICRVFSVLEEESRSPITEGIPEKVVKIVLKMAIENDLVAPSFTEVKAIILNQKRDHNLEPGGSAENRL